MYGSSQYEKFGKVNFLVLKHTNKEDETCENKIKWVKKEENECDFFLDCKCRDCNNIF
jgi:hypothetical protein